MDKETRLAELRGRYNRKALDTGQRLQGEFFLRLVDEFDQLDQDWTERWLTWIYDGMYNRGLLDDKTRVLIVIGECCVSDEQVQLPNHIRSAIRCGATPVEVQEVILQSAVYAGMPKMIKSMRTFRALMKELGTLNLTDPVFRGDARD
ncbi:MAG TPA: carboxymuconolactone decarboxylase family protein [Candidatus Nitrosotalea sp.]|nr:carboxymuconolactone decarboxylase family protein [Candidatus Nitrosotalea sp.]